ASKPFMYEMAHAVRDLMKDAYPELVENAERVSKVIYEEERRFAHTLDEGLAELDQVLGESWLSWLTDHVNNFSLHHDIKYGTAVFDELNDKILSGEFPSFQLDSKAAEKIVGAR